MVGSLLQKNVLCAVNRIQNANLGTGIPRIPGGISSNSALPV